MTRDFWGKRKANKYTQCVGQQLPPLLLINLAGDRFWPTSGHKIEKCCTWPSVPVGRIVWGQYFEKLAQKKQQKKPEKCQLWACGPEHQDSQKQQQGDPNFPKEKKLS